MDPGVRATCTDDCRWRIRDTGYGVLDAALNGPSFTLALPTVETGTVVFDAKRNFHGRDRPVLLLIELFD